MGKKAELTQEELQAMPMQDLTKLLNEKERRFVAEYMIDLNGTAAARRSGYSEKNASSQASRMLRKPEIMEYRDRKVKEACAAAGITPEFVQLGCMEIFQRCMGKKPVQEWDSATRAWVDSGEWQFDARGALKALDSMAALLGMRDAKKDGDGNQKQESVEEFLSRTGGNDREF